jgi:hypothetical protein
VKFASTADVGRDPGQSDFCEGSQCPPVNWSVNTERKKAFFNPVKRVTGAI